MRALPEYALPTYIGTFSRYAALGDANAGSNMAQGTGTAFGASNRAYYVPVSIPFWYPVRRLFVGSHTTGTNYDLGIYDAAGNRIYSTGAVASVTGNLLQYATPTPFVLPPGRYYFALAADNTSATLFLSTTLSANRLRLGGVLMQDTAYTLPASMSPATMTDALYPVCGITRTPA